jgi:hypothetical protein
VRVRVHALLPARLVRVRLRVRVRVRVRVCVCVCTHCSQRAWLGLG